MVNPHRQILVPTADELRAAPHIDTQGGRLEVFLQRLHALASLEAALALRLAMVLACIRQFDVSALGYSGFRAFCAERIDWGQAWIRALVRLVESPLHHVKAAAAAGALPLRWAVQAPGKVSVDEQSAWLAGPELEEARRCAERRVVAKPGKRRLPDRSGPHGDVVHAATPRSALARTSRRKRAHVLQGRPARYKPARARDILHRSGESTTVADMARRANAPHNTRCLTADASPMRAPHARAMGSLVRAYLDTPQADRFCPPGRVGAWQDAPHEVR